MTARITTSRTMTVQSSQLSVGNLRSFIEGQPNDTTVRVSAPGDGNQLDPGTTTLTVADPFRAQTNAFACSDHQPVQHRDRKEPWYNRCGLTSDGREPAVRGATATRASCWSRGDRAPHPAARDPPLRSTHPVPTQGVSHGLPPQRAPGRRQPPYRAAEACPREGHALLAVQGARRQDAATVAAAQPRGARGHPGLTRRFTLRGEQLHTHSPSVQPVDREPRT